MAPAVDVLGVHNAGGRGCGACHVPHGDISSSDAGIRSGAGLWEPGAPLASRQAIAFGQHGHPVHPVSANLLMSNAEVAGVVLCLSCHDGNVAPQNMLATGSYEQRAGMDEQTDSVDHPLGAAAKIPLGNGLEFHNGEFVVIPGSPYAQFVANYGWPSLAPAMRSNPYGIDQAGRPYLVCTTCHDQHAMSVYLSSQRSPIAGDHGMGNYTTFFFVNGPYNPNLHSMDTHASPSSVQFCRQCHFSFSNEANNTNNVRTLF